MPSNPNLQPIKKRKKNAPDRQQPEWLFPADEANPALKPHKEPTEQDKLEKQRSIDFLTRRSVGAPMKPAPPVQLLNLIGAFLAEYGFTSTGRLFSTERQGRSRLDGWRDESGGKPEKGMPTLAKIYKDWRKEWDERRVLDMTSTDEGDDAATKREKMLAKRERVDKQKKSLKDDITSSSGSSSSGSSSSDESDTKMRDVPQVKKSIAKKASSGSRSSSSSSTTSSDSDADDEEDVPVTKPVVQKPKPNALKRKASSSSNSSSSATDSTSSSSNDAPKSKKAKIATKFSTKTKATVTKRAVQVSNKAGKAAAKKAQSSSGDSSSDSTSTSESESSPESRAKNTPLPASSGSDSSSDSESDSSLDKMDKKKPIVNSDTSATLSDGPKKVSPGSSETDSSSNDSVADTKGKLSPPLPPIPAAKLPRKTNVPFSRIPKDIKVESKLASNAYIPYNYAQQAHEDLIVTKGKGFTKEKNKKKRGSYRGGYIDVDGKKGIKFE